MTLIKFYGGEKISLKHTEPVINLSRKNQITKKIKSDSKLIGEINNFFGLFDPEVFLKSKKEYSKLIVI